MLFARNLGVSSPHDTCGWHSCAECLLKLGCARECMRVCVPPHVHERSTRARPFLVCVGRVSFCALSAVSLRLSRPSHTRTRARAHTASASRLSFTSLSLPPPFDCVVFSRVRARRSVAGQARGRGAERNAGEEEREGGKERGRKRKGGRIREGR